MDVTFLSYCCSHCKEIKLIKFLYQIKFREPTLRAAILTSISEIRTSVIRVFVMAKMVWFGVV
jgi:hypothetical protein